ncbi:MAG: glycosyltransferase family 39 protein, partial [Vicinamibacterales bacterium]
MTKRAVGAWLVAAGVIKVLILIQLADHPLLRPEGELDSGYYVTLARQAASGDWALGHRVFFVSPLYVYFLASLFAVGASMFVVQVVQVALGTAAVALVWSAARCWFDERTAFVAAALMAATGYLTFNEILILQSSLDPFLAALSLLCLSRACRSERPVWWAATGCTLALHALNRPNVLVPAGVLGGFFLVRHVWVAVRQPARRADWGVTIAFVAGLALGLFPVTVRNAMVAGEFAPVSSHGGLNFYIGNNAQADGTYRHIPGIAPSVAGQDRDARRVAEAAEGRALSDTEVSRHFYALGLSWMANEPAAALGLLARKLAYTVNAADVSLNFSYAFYRSDAGTLLPFLFVGPSLLLPFGFFGWLVAAPRRLMKDEPAAACALRARWWLWSTYVPAYTLSVAIFFVAGRYRLPMLVALCVMAAPALVWLVDVARRRLLVAEWRSILVLVVLAALTHWPTGLDDGRDTEGGAMVTALIDARRDPQALALLQRLERSSRRPADLIAGAAQVFAERGEREQSLALVQRAGTLAPADDPVNAILGEALSAAGRSADAIPYLQRAVDRRFHGPRSAIT